MRISTGMIYNSGLSSIQQRSSSLLHVQQQVSSGRRILTPSDDPVAAAQALDVSQSQSVNKQYQSSQDNAKGTLGLMDSQLSSMNDLLTRVRELTVNAGNAALSPSDRNSIAAELRSRFDELVGLANSTDGTGQYLFSGYQGATKPFAGSVDKGVGYLGDDGNRTLQISGSRQLPISASGNDVFMRIANGNGTFVTGIQNAKPINDHAVSINGGTVVDPKLWSAAPTNMEMRFWVDSAGGNVATSGYTAAGIAAPATIVASPAVDANDTFNISVDGGAATPVTLTAGPFSVAQFQADLDTALGVAAPAAGSASVSLDANNRIVITSSSKATATTSSSIALSAAAGDTGQFQSLFGTTPPVATNGLYSVPGQVFYDLVDKVTGSSLYTGAASTAGGGANTYTHVYTSGASVPLASSGPFGTTAFDFGSNVVVSGIPATGDKFAIDKVNGALTTSPPTITHVSATIDKGVVTDTLKWTAPPGKGDQNTEIRFWVNPADSRTYYDLVDSNTGNSLLHAGTPSASGPGGTYTQPYASVHGTLTGAADLTNPANLSIVTGTNDRLDLTIDGVKRSITLTGAAYATPDDLRAEVQTQFNNAVPPIAATASLDPTGQFLVLTSNSVYGQSAISLTAPAPANSAAATILGAATAGTALQYSASTTINLKGATFDYGASVTIGGNPAAGDAFTIASSKDTSLGNGYFVTAAKTQTDPNMGSGIVGKGEVIDATKWESPYNSRQLEVRFWKDPKDTRANAPVYYDLVDAKTEKSLFTDTISTAGGSASTYTSAHVFKSGEAISFDHLAVPYVDFGASVTINGTPASGDVFTLKSSSSESIFETLANLIRTVEGPAGPVGAMGNAELQNKLGAALTSLAAAGDNIDRVRADVGTRLGEVDDLTSVSSNLDLQYASTLSNLQDVDYATAITNLIRQQTELQAAQQSFSKVSQLSLFNYL
jgi:flagellar hook-associated protein 3 FlgL